MSPSPSRSPDYLEEAIRVVGRQVGAYLREHYVPRSILREDLCQEATLRMLKHIWKYNPSRGALSTFLENHTRGAIRDFLRRCPGHMRYSGQNATLVSLSDGEPEDNQCPDLFFRGICLSEFMNLVDGCLSERQRKVLVLFYWERKTLKEIGLVIGFKEARACQIRLEAEDILRKAFFDKGLTRVSQIIG